MANSDVLCATLCLLSLGSGPKPQEKMFFENRLLCSSLKRAVGSCGKGDEPKHKMK